MSDHDGLSSARYVSLTTYRRDGSPVATPVWIAPFGDRYVVITQAASHKVRRLRRDRRVEVRPCGLRGGVDDDAPTYAGTARVLEGEEARAGVAAIRRKYGLAARLWPIVGAISSRLRRRPNDGGAVIELSLEETANPT